MAAAPLPDSDPEPKHLWLTLFTGRTGGPVYWLTRGTEFVVVDGVATPVKGRISVIAATARARPDGSTRVAYLLQGCNVTATGFDFTARLFHPITGEEISTTVTSPLRLGWNLASSGELTEELVAANGTRATYRGETWESPGDGNGPTATLKMNIRLDRPNGAVETFAEVSRSRARSLSVATTTTTPSEHPHRSDDFVAAESETFTVHELPDKAKFKGTTVLSMSMNRGLSHRSADDLRQAMRAEESAALTGFFEQLPSWIRER